MNNIQCFKIKNGTDFDNAVKEHFSLLPKWGDVFDEVGILLGEKITRLAFCTDDLWVDLKELKNEENKKLFTKDGRIKRNSKRAKKILESYKSIIKSSGLDGYEELKHISFRYGLYGVRGQKLESFRTGENDIYYKADFDLEKRTGGLVVPITEIEYEEKYLEELKKQEMNKKE